MTSASDTPPTTLGPRRRGAVGILLALFILLPVPLGLILASGDDVDGERRALAELPELSLDADALRALPGGLEAYFNDRFPLRARLIEAKAWVDVYVFRISPSKKVSMGIDGWFFEGYGERRMADAEEGIVEDIEPLADYLGLLPFSDEELAHWTRVLEERQLWLAERGIPFLYTIAPAKHAIYSEYRKPAVRALRGTSRRQQLTRHLAANSDVSFLDLEPELLAAKSLQPYPELYYRTDGHWNFYGSFRAYQAVVRRLDALVPGHSLSPVELDAFDIQVDEDWRHGGFTRLIGLRALAEGEHYPALVPKEGSSLRRMRDFATRGVRDVKYPRTRLEKDGKKSQRVVRIQNPDGALSGAVVFGTSFSEKYLYYLSQHVKDLVFLRHDQDFSYEIFDFIQPDFVLQELYEMYVVTRRLPQNPPPVQVPYLRRRFAALKMASNATRTTSHPVRGCTRRTDATCEATGDFVKLELEPLPLSPDRAHVLHVVLEGARRGVVELRCREPQGEVLKVALPHVPSADDLYFDLGQGQRERCTLTLLELTEPGDSLQLPSVEVRPL